MWNSQASLSALQAERVADLESSVNNQKLRSVAEISAGEKSLYRENQSPFFNQTDIYMSVVNPCEKLEMPNLLSQNELAQKAKPYELNAGELLADKSVPTEAERTQHFSEAKAHATEGWNALPEHTRKWLSAHGYRVEVFKNRDEFFDKYHEKEIKEQDGVAGYTSRKSHVIAVFSEPSKDVFTEPYVSIANVVFHEAGHALNNINGEGYLKSHPEAAAELKAKGRDPNKILGTWYDKPFALVAKECLSECPGVERLKLSGGRYIAPGLSELFAECFALAHERGSDPALDPVLLKYFGKLIRFMQNQDLYE